MDQNMLCVGIRMHLMAEDLESFHIRVKGCTEYELLLLVATVATVTMVATAVMAMAEEMMETALLLDVGGIVYCGSCTLLALIPTQSLPKLSQQEL